MQRNFKELVRLLNQRKNREVLGKEKSKILARAVQDLSHSVHTRNVRKANKAVGIISKVLVEILDL